MSRRSSTGVRGLYRGRDGSFRIDLRWKEPTTGVKRRYREKLPKAIPAPAAKARAREVLALALAGGWNPDAKPAPKLKEALDEYVKWCATNRPNAKARREAIAKRLLASIGDKMLSEISTLDVERFKRDRRAAGRLIDERETDEKKPTAAATVNRDLEVLRHFFRLAASWGWVTPEHADDLRKVPKLREPPGRVRYLSADEEARLLGALPIQVRRIVIVGLLSGMRQSEVVTLRREYVDLDARLISLPTSKANKVRRIFVNDALAAVLADVMAEHEGPVVFVSRLKEPYTADGVRTIFRRAIEKAGITNFHFHDLRHTTATRLRAHGVGLDVVADVLGHATLQMARRYAHIGAEMMREAMAVLSQPAKLVEPSKPVTQPASPSPLRALPTLRR